MSATEPDTVLKAFVYSGPGAGTRSVLSAVEGLKGTLATSILVCCSWIRCCLLGTEACDWHLAAVRESHPSLVAGR